MNNWIKFILALLLLIFIFGCLSIWYLNSGSKGPDNTVWQSYIGRDTTVGILPDKYANYFTYTLARTDQNIAYRIKGEFPDTRYFSFNVYSLGDNTTQGSLVDYQIETDSGLPNPFLVDADSMAVGKNYTVHIVPKKLEALSLKDSADLVEMQPARLPKALNLRWIVRRQSLPKMVERLGLLYNTENKESMDGPHTDQEYVSLPFHAIDTKGFIENNDNRYLLSAITKEEDEVYVFKFKAPSFTTGPSDLKLSDVRYWSFNLGNEASYNFNAIKDEEAILDADGYVNIVLAEKDKEIEQLTADLHYNFLEWNMPWKKAFILFRHMLANQNFEAQIDDVKPIGTNTVDYKETEAQLFIGDYAPQGIRMSKENFLEEYGM